MSRRRRLRRSFLSALGLVVLAPRLAAQPAPRLKVVGYLSGGQPPTDLGRAMAEQGFVLGRDYRLEVRTPPNWDPPTLAKAAEELVSLKPDVLLAWQGNRVAALAAATRTIPIVCGGMPDPVGAGFARSLRRPGGNVTGLTFGFAESIGLVFGLLKRIRPELRRVASVHTSGMPVVAQTRGFLAAARAAGVEWSPLEIATGDEPERVLAPLAAEAMFLGAFRDIARGAQVLAAATRLKIAVVGEPREGALMSFTLEHDNPMGRVAAIVIKILRGADPAEIPFEAPERPAFALNRRTARAIGVTIPPDVLLRATEVID